MTADDFRRAFVLWKRYQCDTAEYQQLADRLGMRTTELTSRCWHHNYALTHDLTRKEVTTC